MFVVWVVSLRWVRPHDPRLVISKRDLYGFMRRTRITPDDGWHECLPDLELGILRRDVKGDIPAFRVPYRTDGLKYWALKLLIRSDWRRFLALLDRAAYMSTGTFRNEQGDGPEGGHLRTHHENLRELGREQRKVREDQAHNIPRFFHSKYTSDKKCRKNRT